MTADEMEERLGAFADQLATVAAEKVLSALAEQRERLEAERQQLACEREMLTILLNHNLAKIKTGVSLWLARN